MNQITCPVCEATGYYPCTPKSPADPISDGMHPARKALLDLQQERPRQAPTWVATTLTLTLAVPIVALIGTAAVAAAIWLWRTLTG